MYIFGIHVDLWKLNNLEEVAVFFFFSLFTVGPVNILTSFKVPVPVAR